MKKIVLMMCLISGTMISAQSKYEVGMTKAISDLNKAETGEDFGKVSAFFERIASAEKDKWLPYYYAAFTNNMIAFKDKSADKDVVAERSLSLVAKAELLEKNNCEILCLKNMIYTSQMLVDPMQRWQTHGAKAGEALEAAKVADPANPRVYFLEGQSKMNTPKAFGGGKKVAKPIFEKSVALFTSFKPESNLHPDWGKNDAEEALRKCTK